MRRNRALGAVAVGVTFTLALTACSSSGSTNTKPKTNTNPSNSKTSTAPRASSAVPLNTNEDGTPQKGGTLHMLGTGDVDYLDPNITYFTTGYLALRMWSRELLTYPAVPGKTTTATADLATQVPTAANGGITDGGKTFKLTIRNGAMWDTAPARQVTAADAVRGLKRTCNPAEPFGGMPDFESLIVGLSAYCAGYAKVNGKSASAMAAYQNSHNIAGVSVDPSNPLTVVYKLTSPASYFSSMLAMPAFSPAPKEYDQYIPASAQLAQHTIADGPYKVTSYVPTKSIDFSRNSAWKASTDPIRKAYVDNIVVNETGNQDAIQQQLQANTTGADMEWDSFPPVTVLPQLIASKDKDLNLSPTFGTNPYLVYNTVSPNNGGALAKTAVRQAISEALDRATLIQDAGGPAVSPPLTHVLPAGISGTQSNTSPSPFPFNVSKAKADLKAAGVSNMTLKLLYAASASVNKSMFTTIQQALSAVGIKVTGVPVPNADLYTKYLEVPSVAKAGTWDLTLTAWFPDWFGDAAKSYFGPLFYGNDGKAGSAFPPNGTDFGFYNNPQVNKLVNEASTQADAATAAKLWAQADSIVTKEAAIFAITASNQPTYHASHVHNTVFMAGFSQIDPTNVWLSKS